MSQMPVEDRAGGVQQSAERSQSRMSQYGGVDEAVRPEQRRQRKRSTGEGKN